MSGFSALLKLSQSQTAESELAIQTQMASHQLQLEKKRREQEAKERKERELEAKLRARRFEEQRKEDERKRQRVEEESAREKALARREEQLRDALKYGPRKAASGSGKARGGDKGGESEGGSGLTREELRRRQTEVFDSSSSVLTREEKRKRKLAAELRRTTGSGSRRSGTGHRTISLPDGRMVRRLPGGAVDCTTVSRLADPEASMTAPSADLTGKSARERLAAIPSTLMKLNTNKRDLRTIDEYLVDRAKAKQANIIAGEEAKEFSDWFGKSKKKAGSQPSSSSQQQQHASNASSRAVSNTNTPSGSPAPTPNPSPGGALVKTKSTLSGPSSKAGSPFLKSINPKPNTVSRPPSGAVSSPSKKRSHSTPDDDITPPPAKRTQSSASHPVGATSRPATTYPSGSSRRPSSAHAAVDLSSEIWSIFGKDKKSYMARDVLSDDEDMEADTESVLREEARSARLALKEDEYALWEERKHEEEKRRRRRERERKERA